MIENPVQVESRLNNFDLLRIVSAIAVIVIHTNFHYFEKRYLNPTFSVHYCVENFLNIITRFSVPVFVMMSGGFNLKNNQNSKAKIFYKRALWKIGIPAFFAALFFFLFDEISAILIKGNVIQPIIGVATGFYALWFLYMLIGLYILTPFIIKLKNCLNAKEYTCSGFILLLWGVLSQAVSNYKLPYTIGTIGAFLGYYIMGDVLLNVLKTQKRSIFYLICALFLVCFTWIIRYLGVSYYTYVTYRNFFSPTICGASLCIFLAFKQIKVNHNFSFLSGLTFYIYVFHTWVLNLIFKGIERMNVDVDELVLIPFIVILTLSISGLISYCYKRFWNNQVRIKKWLYKWTIWQ